MTPQSTEQPRLTFLVRVILKERRHLETTDGRLFDPPLTADRLALIESDPDLAERIDAFVSRFGRLQDTLGDKLLPALLGALGERAEPFIDNLDRGERLGWIASSDDWMAMRRLRNQMIHEYVEDPLVLQSALAAAHRYVPVLIAAVDRLADEVRRRGWA